MVRKILIWCGLLFFVVSLHAAQDETLAHSSFPLLDNRFRLDFGVDEITLVIYRKPGSAPVILVKPDGSKIYAHRHGDNVQWLVTQNFDVITITLPTPGPWQVVGSVDKRNRMRIISDLKLEMEPFPSVIYQGEQIKVTAHLANHSEKLNDDAFFKSTTLSLILAQRGVNIASEDILRAGRKLGVFTDNGEGLDEVPRDGIFTGQLSFDVMPGKFRLFTVARNATFQRMKVQDVTIAKTPVEVDVIQDDNKDPIAVEYKFDTQQLEPQSISANVIFKATDDTTKKTSETNITDGKWRIDLSDIDSVADYDVVGTGYATTRFGREITFTLPKVRFHISPENPIADDNTPKGLSLPPLPEPQAPPPPPSYWSWLLLSFFFIALLVFVSVLIWRLRPFSRKKTATTEEVGDKKGKQTGVDLTKGESG